VHTARQWRESRGYRTSAAFPKTPHLCYIINMTKEKTQRIAWHPVYLQAYKAELWDYQEVLDFYGEVILGEEPLKADLLIIKKPRDAVILKNIAVPFRGHNLVEYKGLGSILTIESFHKAFAYVNLYKLRGDPNGKTKAEREIDIEDITLTLMSMKHPYKLFKYLKDTYHYDIKKRENGIYIVTGHPVLIQVIVTSELSEDNLWLKGVSRNLDAKTLHKILMESTKENMPEMGNYLASILQANASKIKEVMNMGNSAMTLEKVLKETGFIERWEQRGIQIGEARGIQIGEKRGETRTRNEMLSLLKSGKSPAEILRLYGEQ
jgi:hypothetical protein